jgi:hypothetical protein
VLAAWGAILLPGACSAGEHELRDRRHWIDQLRRELDGNASWVRVHAAEALIAHGRREEAAAAFANEVDSAESPYRIGVWRVMARSAEADEERES